MSTESQVIDPFEAALNELRAKRDEIDRLIAGIESFRGGSPSVGTFAAATNQNVSLDQPGAFLGKSIVDAAKMLLAAKRQPLRNPDFVTPFKVGGLVLNSKEPANTIGSVSP